MHQTLYLDTYGLTLKKENGVLNVFQNGQRVHVMPAAYVASVVISSEGVSITGGAISLCRDHAIPIFFMPRNTAEPSVMAPVESRWPERQAAQIRASVNAGRIDLVCRGVVGAKIRNQLSLMKYFRNSRQLAGGAFDEQVAAYGAVVKEILNGIEAAAPESDIPLLRGRFFSMEGRAATQYWGAVSCLVPEELEFPGRQRKGAKDVVNQMLNYGYAILANKTRQSIIRAGLSSYFSFLHSHQPGRANLVYDLMEPFRPWGVDRVVLGICGKGPTPESDDDGLTSGTRKHLIKGLEKRWEKDGLMTMLDRQVMALRRVTEDGATLEPVLFQSNGKVRLPKGVDGRGRKHLS
jgi:CRISPR-associated protein Cas1